jgi:hypothetical protein
MHNDKWCWFGSIKSSKSHQSRSRPSLYSEWETCSWWTVHLSDQCNPHTCIHAVQWLYTHASIDPQSFLNLISLPQLIYHLACQPVTFCSGRTPPWWEEATAWEGSEVSNSSSRGAERPTRSLVKEVLRQKIIHQKCNRDWNYLLVFE